MNRMPPRHLKRLIKQEGTSQTLPAGQVFHSQDFEATMFMLEKGYVKRYQITQQDKRVIELIYGPGHIFPLSQLYQKIFSLKQNQAHLLYVYQAMTDVEIWRLPNANIEAALKTDSNIYIDLYYESGLRLKANIDRLASNAIADPIKKVAHQLVCLGDDFGVLDMAGTKQRVKIDVPLTAVDMAEQLNISIETAETALAQLTELKLISVVDSHITILDLNFLKDMYV